MCVCVQRENERGLAERYRVLKSSLACVGGNLEQPGTETGQAPVTRTCIRTHARARTSSLAYSLIHVHTCAHICTSDWPICLKMLLGLDPLIPSSSFSVSFTLFMSLLSRFSLPAVFMIALFSLSLSHKKALCRKERYIKDYFACSKEPVQTHLNVLDLFFVANTFVFVHFANI